MTRNNDCTNDNHGRRTSETIAYVQTGQHNTSRSYSYYPGSELLKTDGTYGYVYDANGNLIAKGSSYSNTASGLTVNDSAGSWKYAWDKQNRLSTVQKYIGSGYVTVAS